MDKQGQFYRNFRYSFDILHHLSPHFDFDVEKCLEYARQVNPQIEIIQLSTKSGEGMNEWYNWLEKQSKQVTRTGICLRNKLL